MQCENQLLVTPGSPQPIGRSHLYRTTGHYVRPTGSDVGVKHQAQAEVHELYQEVEAACSERNMEQSMQQTWNKACSQTCLL